MKNPSKIFSIYVTLAVFCFCFAINLVAQKTEPPVDKKSPVIPKIIQINEITVKDHLKPKGKPLLVNFWATWCIPCRQEFPDLVEIHNKYKGKIDFITITLDDLAEINRDVPKFLKEMKATMPTFLLYTNDENTVISSISKDWAGGLPFTILYDKNGKLVHTRQGKIKPDLVKEKIVGLLADNIR